MRNFKRNLQTALSTSAAIVLIGGVTLSATEVDQRIEASAKASHNFKTYLKDDKIAVNSLKGVVTLTGSVAQPHHKVLAENTVEGLPGVKNVINKLEVTDKQPDERSDSWITMKVKTVLVFHKNVQAIGTEINTQDGIVTLSGKAESEAQKQLTGEYAKDVEGVKEVRNNLVVTQSDKVAKRTLGEKIDDTSITAQVKTTLLFHKSTSALATKVTTKDGVVSLHGEAQNGAEKDLVTKLVEDINGVKKVNNHMNIRKG